MVRYTKLTHKDYFFEKGSSQKYSFAINKRLPRPQYEILLHTHYYLSSAVWKYTAKLCLQSTATFHCVCKNNVISHFFPVQIHTIIPFKTDMQVHYYLQS